jgi:hypothetical protein
MVAGVLLGGRDQGSSRLFVTTRLNPSLAQTLPYPHPRPRPAQLVLPPLPSQPASV